jgi:hypothetical protein
MAFNITSWGRSGRGFGRGDPPPRGSIEWIAVGDMWEPAPPPRSASGFSVYKVSFTDVDAGDRWMSEIDRSVRQARAIHKDEILSAADEREWDALLAKWRPLLFDLRAIPGSPAAMLPSAKRRFDEIVNASKVLHDRFIKKGMSKVPVPYAGELVVILRGTPRKLTASEMSARLAAGARCGEKMLDANAPWYAWMISSDHVPLEKAIEAAKVASAAYARSAESPATYAAGDPAYDEFLRRLAKIWIESAGLYGIQETLRTASAELKDDVRKMPERALGLSLGLLAAAGLGYLGLHWLAGRRAPATVVVGVPDAIQDEGESP